MSATGFLVAGSMLSITTATLHLGSREARQGRRSAKSDYMRGRRRRDPLRIPRRAVGNTTDADGRAEPEVDHLGRTRRGTCVAGFGCWWLPLTDCRLGGCYINHVGGDPLMDGAGPLILGCILFAAMGSPFYLVGRWQRRAPSTAGDSFIRGRALVAMMLGLTCFGISVVLAVVLVVGVVLNLR